MKIAGKDINIKEQDFTWLDKVIDIHRKYGLKEINIHELRKISKEDALEAAKYLYKDYLANVGKVKGLGEAFGSQLEEFTVDEKERAVGALFDMVDRCEIRKGDYSEKIICNISQVKDVAKDWDLDYNKLVRAYTTRRYFK